MSRGDAGDIETGQLFSTAGFGTTSELLHLREESRVWDSELASLVEVDKFPFCVEDVPRVPFLGSALQGVSLGGL